MKTGKDLGLTSTMGKEIYEKIKSSDNGVFKSFKKCHKCKGRGTLRDVITGKVEFCNICKGWGFIKE